MLGFLSRSHQMATRGELHFRAAGLSLDGSGRAINQDAWGIDWESRVLAIADGIGGGECGEIASRLAVDTLLHELTNQGREPDTRGAEEAMGAAFEAAGESIRFSAAARNCECMGTTLVCVVLNGSRLTLGWAGDSRAYLVRNNHARLLTHDHTFAQKLADVGAIPEDAIAEHSFRNTLWNFVGLGDASGIAEIVTLNLQSNDRLILTTDGVTGPLFEEDLARIVSQNDSPERVARKVVQASVQSGSTDDATCLVAIAGTN